MFPRWDAKHLYFEGVRADKLCWRGHELDDERRDGGEEGHGAQGEDVAKLPRAPLPDKVNDLGQGKRMFIKGNVCIFLYGISCLVSRLLRHCILYCTGASNFPRQTFFFLQLALGDFLEYDTGGLHPLLFVFISRFFTCGDSRQVK